MKGSRIELEVRTPRRCIGSRSPHIPVFRSSHFSRQFLSNYSFEFVLQLELFPEFQPKPSSAPQLTMSSQALPSWKQRILEHQQSESAPQPQQGMLFELAPNPCHADSIDPFALQLHNLSFCDRPDWGDRTCLYFVIDNAFPLLLYVGETHRTPKQRWANHGCHSYIANYIELHRRYSLDVAVGIAFWYGAPSNQKKRLQLESELIYKWRSPFNKECWQWWGQPFGK